LEAIRSEELMIEAVARIEPQAAVASLDELAAENPWLQAG
jgi:hypothetical protein